MDSSQRQTFSAASPRETPARSGLTIPDWVLPWALVCVLMLIYASSFTMDFIALDETAFVGRQSATYNFYYHALAHGRPLAVLRPFVYDWAGYDPGRIQSVRFASAAIMAGFAVLLFRFLRRESGKPFFSFFTTLLFFSQLPFQTLSGFSLDLVSAAPPPMLLSLTAFWMHFYVLPRKGVRSWKAWSIVLLLLIAAMQAGQTWAFLAMVPMSFLVLTDRERFAQARTFLLLAAASIAISMVAYKLGLQALHEEGRAGYEVGEDVMGAVTGTPLTLIAHALDPRTYWSAFKLWNWPFPFHNTPESSKLREGMAGAIMIAWFVLVLGAMARELLASSGTGKATVARWCAALACLGFGAMVILADSPFRTHEPRPHLTLVFTGICIFIAAHALSSLAARYSILRTNLAQGVAIVLVVMTAFGAQSGVLKGYVDNRSNQLDFMRTELCARPPEDFDRIVVIFAPREWIGVCEPCDRYSGRIIHDVFHARRPERYWYAMTTIGIEPKSKEIVFVEEYSDPRERDLVVDWRKFFSARKRYRTYFPWAFPFEHRRIPAGSAQ
jgi:hypothetical protein